MSDTLRTDAELLRILDDDKIDLNDEVDRMADFARQLERELAATTAQLTRICQEGFGNDDTIGLEPADDYVLRKLAEWQDGLKVNCSKTLAQVFNAIRRRIAASQAGQAELLARLQERTESHLAASARDVQTIQQQAVELAKWQALAEGLASRLNLWHNAAGNRCNVQDAAALAAYEAAKAGGAAEA